jgi:hypothetical protein
MVKNMQDYCLVMQYKNPEGRFINNDAIISGKIKAPKKILDLGFRHNDEIFCFILEKVRHFKLSLV